MCRIILHRTVFHQIALQCILSPHHLFTFLAALVTYTSLNLTHRTCVGAQKEGGGPNVFMREALNLVDFFVSNYVTQDVDLSTLEVSQSFSQKDSW